MSLAVLDAPPRWRLSQLVDCVNAAVLPRTRVSEPTDVGERRCYEEKRALWKVGLTAHV